MAIRFEKVFGSTADVWLRLQTAFDLVQARLREAEIVATVHVPAKKAPQPKQPVLI
jgi:plasmid maintenance system antidote protein VapI